MTDKAAPEPPDPASLDLLLEPLLAGTELWRVHRLSRRPTEFNPGRDCGRFHPLVDADGSPVPTLYAAATWQGAICEVIFRDVPLRGLHRHKALAELTPRALSRLQLTTAVSLVELRTLGLRRLQLRRLELIDTEADHYPRTARWAQAFHRARLDAHGLVWMARLADTEAMVFFGDRLEEKSFSVVADAIPLGEGRGLAMVTELAEKARILITR